MILPVGYLHWVWGLGGFCLGSQLSGAFAGVGAKGRQDSGVLQSIYMHIHTHTYAHIHVHTNIHIHTHIHTYMHTCLRTYIHTAHISFYTHIDSSAYEFSTIQLYSYVHRYNFLTSTSARMTLRPPGLWKSASGSRSVRRGSKLLLACTGVFRFQGFRVQGSGFQGLGFRVLGFQGLGFGVQGLGVRAQGLGFRV